MDSFDDGVDHVGVFRLAGKGAVQIDQMQTLRPRFNPAPRHRYRIVGEHGVVFHTTLAQADTFSFLQVNCGYQQHI